MKKIYFCVSFILIITTVLCMCSCTKKSGNKGNTVEFATADRNAPKTKIGSGEKSFFFEITDKERKLTSYNILSDEEMVGIALSNYGLAEFDADGESMKISVIGKDLEDGDYWNFYVDGVKYEGNPFELAIKENTIYSFVYVID